LKDNESVEKDSVVVSGRSSVPVVWISVPYT
jgi:hypothetical protein